MLTQKLLKPLVIDIINFAKTFLNFIANTIISKLHVGPKSLLRQGFLELKFYGDLVYKLKKNVGPNNISAQFIKIISYLKKFGYNIYTLEQTTCFPVNPITVGNFDFLYNCMPMGLTPESMMVPT